MKTSLEQIFTNAASGLSAQSIRMNTIASNLANAGSIGGSEETTYHAKKAIFSEVKSDVAGLNADEQPIGGVRVTDIAASPKPLEKRYDPSSPLADKTGYVYITNVNTVEEMTDMIAASKDYQANVEVMNTTKTMVGQAVALLNSR